MSARGMAIVMFVAAGLVACSSSNDASPGSEAENDGGDDGSSDAAAPVGDAGGGEDAGSCAVTEPLEASMAATLDTTGADASITKDPDFTVLLETFDGRTFAHSHGASTADTPYESASTSKWVSAAVVLDAVDQKALALDTTAHDLRSFWTETSVTLRDLLSFTDGFNKEPLCLNGPTSDFTDCVQKIFTQNEGKAVPPGTQFYYSGTHLQVAGLMAMTAKHVPTWGALFDDFKSRTGLFPHSTYDLPSSTNPRLAGGMHWTATDYMGFLRALAQKKLLTDEARQQMFANQRGNATVGYSPTLSGESGQSAIGEDWAYGLGNWLECPTATQPNTYDCGEGHRNSSPGSYGAYPFIDFDHRYFGIVARQGSLGSGAEGVHVFRSIASLAAQWADATCP